jgi:hypothetical protein
MASDVPHCAMLCCEGDAWPVLMRPWLCCVSCVAQLVSLWANGLGALLTLLAERLK